MYAAGDVRADEIEAEDGVFQNLSASSGVSAASVSASAGRFSSLTADELCAEAL